MTFASDFTKLSKTALLKHFKQERLEWLKLGMREDKIMQIHFGKDGDYSIWLAERKHTRSDHKYCMGKPVSLEEVDPDNIWISDPRNAFDDVVTNVDVENALGILTKLQRYSFIEVCMKERSYVNVARELNKHHSTIQEAVKTSKKKLQKYYTSAPRNS